MQRSHTEAAPALTVACAAAPSAGAGGDSAPSFRDHGSFKANLGGPVRAMLQLYLDFGGDKPLLEQLFSSNLFENLEAGACYAAELTARIRALPSRTRATVTACLRQMMGEVFPLHINVTGGRTALMLAASAAAAHEAQSMPGSTQEVFKLLGINPRRAVELASEAALACQAADDNLKDQYGLIGARRILEAAVASSDFAMAADALQLHVPSLDPPTLQASMLSGVRTGTTLSAFVGDGSDGTKLLAAAACARTAAPSAASLNRRFRLFLAPRSRATMWAPTFMERHAREVEAYQRLRGVVGSKEALGVPVSDASRAVLATVEELAGTVFPTIGQQLASGSFAGELRAKITEARSKAGQRDGIAAQRKVAAVAAAAQQANSTAIKAAAAAAEAGTAALQAAGTAQRADIKADLAGEVAVQARGTAQQALAAGGALAERFTQQAATQQGAVLRLEGTVETIEHRQRRMEEDMGDDLASTKRQLARTVRRLESLEGRLKRRFGDIDGDGDSRGEEGAQPSAKRAAAGLGGWQAGRDSVQCLLDFGGCLPSPPASVPASIGPAGTSAPAHMTRAAAAPASTDPIVPAPPVLRPRNHWAQPAASPAIKVMQWQGQPAQAAPQQGLGPAGGDASQAPPMAYLTTQRQGGYVPAILLHNEALRAAQQQAHLLYEQQHLQPWAAPGAAFPPGRQDDAGVSTEEQLEHETACASSESEELPAWAT